MSSCACGSALFPIKPKLTSRRVSGTVAASGFRWRSRRLGGLIRVCEIRALMMNSRDNPSDFVKRTEQAWLISQQPTPIMCSTCHSNGSVECEWCRGTGFFILGDNMLCEVPSKNTTCVICAGKGWMRCADCKGTGFRAKWLEEPPPSPPVSMN